MTGVAVELQGFLRVARAVTMGRSSNVNITTVPGDVCDNLWLLPECTHSREFSRLNIYY